jgi:hypothetical protein
MTERQKHDKILLPYGLTEAQLESSWKGYSEKLTAAAGSFGENPVPVDERLPNLKARAIFLKRKAGKENENHAMLKALADASQDLKAKKAAEAAKRSADESEKAFKEALARLEAAGGSLGHKAH